VVNTGVVKVSSVKYIKTVCHKDDMVENVHIMHLPVGDVDEIGDGCVGVHLGMQLYSCLGPSKLCPRVNA